MGFSGPCTASAADATNVDGSRASRSTGARVAAAQVHPALTYRGRSAHTFRTMLGIRKVDAAAPLNVLAKSAQCGAAPTIEIRKVSGPRGSAHPISPLGAATPVIYLTDVPALGRDRFGQPRRLIPLWLEPGAWRRAASQARQFSVGLTIGVRCPACTSGGASPSRETRRSPQRDQRHGGFALLYAGDRVRYARRGGRAS